MEIRPLDPDQLDVAVDVRTRAFGPLSAGAVSGWKSMVSSAIDDHRAYGLYDGTRLVAMARINDLDQWWGGHSVRMAGIGGVVVAPEDRGRGAGSMLMTAVLERARERGYALSALYPATVPVYRGVGYEFAGVEHKITVAAEAVRQLGRGAMVDLVRAEPTAASELRDLMNGLHQRHRDCGPLSWPLSGWVEEFEDEDNFIYRAADGLLWYAWDGSGTLSISTIIAGSAETLRSFWSVVGSGSSTVETIKAVVSPHDPVRWLLRDKGLATAEDVWWMLRLLDAPAAIAGRGYPVGVDVAVSVELSDPQLPANAGRFRLVIADGRGVLEPDSGSNPVRLTANGLAALYAGTPVSTLRMAGLIDGGTAADEAALDVAFAGRPFMLDYF